MNSTDRVNKLRKARARMVMDLFEEKINMGKKKKKMGNEILILLFILCHIFSLRAHVELIS